MGLAALGMSKWWHALDNYFAKERKGAGGDFMTTAGDVALSARGANYEARAGVRKEMVDALGNVVKSDPPDGHEAALRRVGQQTQQGVLEYQ